ncbi:MAG: glycosyltransferase [Butyrivibrio sp.]|nr:glycosyltransferase [Muribaculum sp.]MCM1552788.1 glycosyltransferase [Butyrivibrio sp.]
MKILIYRYGSICEPDIINAFRRLGLTVIEEQTEMSDKRLSAAERVQLVERVLKTEQPVFVFSINFYPAIAEICHIYRTMYLCWTVDSPVPELFSSSIRRETNHVFLFDQAQYDTFSPYNPTNTYHLPLASCTERFDQVIATITDRDRADYSKDIAFIGSLYNEKNPLHDLTPLSDYAKGYISGLTEASLKLFGYNITEEAMTDEFVRELKDAFPSFYTLKDSVTDSDRYVAAHSYVGMHLAETERIRTLNTLARFFPVDLFTRSDTSALHNVNVHGGVATLTEMPKIFHLCKINLNMTIKPIRTGLPLRIFDIMGCGGFLMTNYQEELPEYFDIGVDLEAYSGMEELVDKCAYYLEHDDERRRVALNGYQKVCAHHTYTHRLKEMIEAIL